MITGSTRGIGLATAVEFLKAGDRVAIFCRHKGHVEAARRLLSSYGKKEHILGIVGDVRKEADAQRIITQCLKHFGWIDILINNAGVGAYKPIEETTEKEWDTVLDTNLKGCFLFMRQVIPIMKKQGRGIVINVSSGLGVEGMANFSAYCASKFGVVGLTQVAADETTDTGIKVYTVLPGAVDTQLMSGSGLEIDPSELMAPAYVAKRIFKLAKGTPKSGQLVEVYS
jgi:3-oxoacyl-[acyl-carrier protein] reductase